MESLNLHHDGNVGSLPDMEATVRGAGLPGLPESPAARDVNVRVGSRRQKPWNSHKRSRRLQFDCSPWNGSRKSFDAKSLPTTSAQPDRAKLDPW